MEIKLTLTNSFGQVLNVVYRDINKESELEDRKIKTVHAYCFHSDKLVLVYSEKKGYWTPPGGSVEEGEDIRGAVRREVREETNMNVIRQCFIGVQDITEPQGIISQTRSVCIVEPYGPFTNDPDGDITEIKLIDPKDYKQYFDWGEIGDHVMARALELKAQIDLELSS
ncbi:MAG: NUDIX hydrolase [Patescibacteria group bacterium]